MSHDIGPLPILLIERIGLLAMLEIGDTSLPSHVHREIVFNNNNKKKLQGQEVTRVPKGMFLFPVTLKTESNTWRKRVYFRM